MLYCDMGTRGLAAMLGIAGVVAACLLQTLPASTADRASSTVVVDASLVARGADLAAIGNCVSCHTRPDGRPFAGGRGIETRFGTLYSTNITPDPETGIGRWSSADFLRAMHEGVDPAGRSLYPAFPYDHFARVTDSDVEAIYAFVMTREAVRETALPNRLRFPMNLRPTLSGWKLLFLDRGAFRPDPQQDAEWNRGAYLVEGLGHCGACHTPRNALGAEMHHRDLDGGESEGWDAPALNASSPAPSRWTAEQLYAYLRHGWQGDHGIAAGPMRPVTNDLSAVPEADVKAIARYVASRMNAVTAVPAAPAVQPDADRAREGEAIFRGACASCHEGDQAGAPPSMRAISLARTTSVNAADARNAIHVIAEGVWPEPGEPGAMMPSFAGSFTEDQMVALLAYVRARYSRAAPWEELKKQVSAVIHSEERR